MRESLLSNPGTTVNAPTASDDVLLSKFGTLLQIFRLYCGTGLLAFPYAVKCGGLVLAPCALVVIGGLNNYSLRMLVHAKRKITEELNPQLPTTLDDLAFATFGYGGRLFTSLAMVLSLLGLCSGYLIFVGNTLRSAFGTPSWSGYTLMGLDINTCTLAATFVSLPLTMIRNYNRVQWSGILGNLSLLAAVAVVFYHVTLHIINPLPPSPNTTTTTTTTSSSLSFSSNLSSMNPASTIKLANLDELPVFLGLVFFSFAIQGVILGVESVTAKPKEFLRVLDWGCVLGISLYCGFGCLSYYSFGTDTTQIIFQSIASEKNYIDLRVVEVLFCLSMVLLYPMQLVPVVQIFERWLNIQDDDGNMLTSGLGEDGRVGTAFSPWARGDVLQAAIDDNDSSGDGQNDNDGDQKNKNGACSGKKCCQQNMLRTTLTLLTGMLAVLFGDVFSQILSIVGALGFSLLSFILPPLIYIKTFGNKLTLGDKALSIVILLSGLIGMVIATFIDAVSIVAYFHGNTTDPCK